MNMFSMKPKFDLAEFLATPAPVGARRGRGGRRGMQFQSSGSSKDTAAAKPDVAADAAETPKD